LFSSVACQELLGAAVSWKVARSRGREWWSTCRCNTCCRSTYRVWVVVHGGTTTQALQPTHGAWGWPLMKAFFLFLVGAGRALEILCVVMGDVDGAVAYCHAAEPVCPKATPLRFAPVATPPRSVDSRRAVTGRLLLLLLSFLLTPAPSEDDKPNEYDVRDMPDEYDVPDMPEYDVPDMPDILAPCLLPRPPTPSPHHTREGAGRVGKAASKTHPHCCSMTQHGSSAHYLAHYSANGQAARAHQVTLPIICIFPPH